MLGVLNLEKMCIAVLWEESVSEATKINPSHLHYWLKLNCVYHWVLCRNLSRVMCITINTKELSVFRESKFNVISKSSVSSNMSQANLSTSYHRISEVQ